MVVINYPIRLLRRLFKELDGRQLYPFYEADRPTSSV